MNKEPAENSQFTYQSQQIFNRRLQISKKDKFHAQID